MIFRKKATITMILMLLIISFTTGVSAVNVDHSLINLVLEKYAELDAKTQTMAISFLEEYSASSATLEVLKGDLPILFKLVLGDNYEEKLMDKGISLDQMRSEIDKMKNWSSDDRFNTIGMIATQNKDGITNIISKYKEIGTDPDQGGSLRRAQNPVQEVVQEAAPKSPVITSSKTSFKDIENHWAVSYIEFAQTQGIIQGKAEGIFAPEDKVTRAEFTAMLARLLGLKADVSTEMPFIDIAKEDWFFDVVRDAFAMGIIQGKGDRFDPNDSITREEMMVIIIRSVSLEGKSASVNSFEAAELLSSFNDQNQLSSWAKTEAATALKLGLVHGKTTSSLAPKSNATRAEAATMIFNLFNLSRS